MSYAKKCEACGWPIEGIDDECPNCVGHLGIDGQPISRGPSFLRHRQTLPPISPGDIKTFHEGVERRVDISDASICDVLEADRRPARVRYRNEPRFHAMVDQIAILLQHGQITPTGLRAAVDLAIELAEEDLQRRMRP